MRLAGGRYVLRGLLGAGAMGSVWRAERREDGEAVAVKALTDPDQAVRFEIEARLLARLSHPRVVRVLDHFAEGRRSYIVMAIVEGEDLRAHLARHGRPGLPVEEAISAATQAAEALAYVHAQHVVHRDVKPQNLVLAPDTGVVLVDFGVAREQERRSSARSSGRPPTWRPRCSPAVRSRRAPTSTASRPRCGRC